MLQEPCVASRVKVDLLWEAKRCQPLPESQPSSLPRNYNLLFHQLPFPLDRVSRVDLSQGRASRSCPRRCSNTCAGIFPELPRICLAAVKEPSPAQPKVRADRQAGPFPTEAQELNPSPCPSPGPRPKLSADFWYMPSRILTLCVLGVFLCTHHTVVFFFFFDNWNNFKIPANLVVSPASDYFLHLDFPPIKKTHGKIHITWLST